MPEWVFESTPFKHARPIPLQAKRIRLFQCHSDPILLLIFIFLSILFLILILLLLLLLFFSSFSGGREDLSGKLFWIPHEMPERQCGESKGNGIMKYGDLKWTDIADMDKASKVVVVPLGSLEQHGRHCPLITDSLLG